MRAGERSVRTERVALEAFGVLVDNFEWISSAVNTDTYHGIAPQESMTVLFKPLSGILKQSKMLPIRYAPITIELKLVSDITAPIISTFGSGTKDFKAETHQPNRLSTTSKLSVTFAL